MNLLTFERLIRFARRGVVVFAPGVDGDAHHIVPKAAVAAPEAGGGVGVLQPPRSPWLRQGEAGSLLTAEIVRVSKKGVKWCAGEFTN